MKIKLITAAVAMIALSGCDVDKTRSGDMPSVDVDVSADAGRLPKYEVEWADVDIGTTTETVEVPEVVVVMEEKQVEVPYMDVNMPDDDSPKSKRTIVVEAEVAGNMHDLQIEKVYAKDRRLFVVSKLKATDKSLEGKTVRVSDRIVINAPDLDLQHFIIGDKPRGDWNNQYTFVANESDLRKRTKGAREIYSR
ncbi:hypothetical protein [Aliiglaciecola litoralis]|uniref:Lipoprotein n=1 Tax=Aliiglaciecola litoralis TaxID=582857 RepID=A0ABP3WVF9_9ALTE